MKYHKLDRTKIKLEHTLKMYIICRLKTTFVLVKFVMHKYAHTSHS